MARSLPGVLLGSLLLLVTAPNAFAAHNITISTGATSGIDTSTPHLFVSNADDAVLNVAELVAALETAPVTVTTGSGGAQNGDLTLAASTPIAPTSTYQL